MWFSKHAQFRAQLYVEGLEIFKNVLGGNHVTDCARADALAVVWVISVLNVSLNPLNAFVLHFWFTFIFCSGSSLKFWWDDVDVSDERKVKVLDDSR